MKVVILEPVVDHLKELVKNSNPEWVYYNNSPKDKDELIERLKGAEAATGHNTYFDEEIFSKCPNLRFVAAPAIGAEMFVDMKAAKKYGVTVMNCPGYNAEAVAETAFMLALGVTRLLPEIHAGLGTGKWVDTVERGSQMKGKKAGIIGNGSISKALQVLLKGWSCEVEYIDSSSSQEQINKLISDNDYVFVCCPLNYSTRGLVSRDRIASMQSNSVLVNVARGPIIDENALYEALRMKKIAGAGLDVFEDEPQYSEVLPESIERFRKLDNVLITPHVAGKSTESGVSLGEIVYANLLSCTEGKPQNIYLG